MKVCKENFSPRPKVDSAILLIDDISKNFFEGIGEESFFEIIKAGFAHKRKVLISNLRDFAKKGNGADLKTAFSSLKISEKARAEDLTLEDWKKLIKSLIFS